LNNNKPTGNKSLSKAAAALGRKGGKATGPSKARKGTSEQMKKWWASPAAAHRRKKGIIPPKLAPKQKAH